MSLERYLSLQLLINLLNQPTLLINENVIKLVSNHGLITVSDHWLIIDLERKFFVHFQQLHLQFALEWKSDTLSLIIAMLISSFLFSHMYSSLISKRMYLWIKR